MNINLDELVFEPILPAQAEDIEELAKQLRAYNHGQLWDNVKKPVGCFIRDMQGKLVAGLFAYDSWGWCSVELVWVDEAYRGNDLASSMLQKIEQYAIDEGISRLKLETGSFQALDFYKKQGYEVYAELEDYPVGATNYYLRKLL